MTTADVLQQSRLAAGLTQGALARRAGTTQSAVSAYERGRKSPSVDTLRRLLAAAGRDLVLDAVPRRVEVDLDGPLGRRLTDSRREVLAILRRYGASRPRVSGSVARGEDGPGSDVDLLVTLPRGAGLLDLVGLQEELTGLLGVREDVVTDGALAADEAFASAVRAEAVPL